MWTPDLEVNLFHALKGHKPTGINRFFHMACIHHKLATSCELKDLTPNHIWAHLKDMYNLDTLNELDELPFPNGVVDFSLPEEMTNPEFMMSAPCSPATSVASTDDSTGVPSRPSNLNLTNLKNSSFLSTPESLASPKRKRNARQAQLLSNSQPSSPAGTPSSSAKRRR
ncbi:MRG/MORF4L-binding protein-like [Hydractinia symbiolongicarpus]|uniref:MRG/MORF4L-binding protein-like n=1 Tax=Hydractinia symbiolongicarpus TaxID=13093 RepID=UPI00254EC90D|nr:MRG/MORF4L-binding protein-like [Hydractinia symbiolongicarpus]